MATKNATRQRTSTAAAALTIVPPAGAAAPATPLPPATTAPSAEALGIYAANLEYSGEAAKTLRGGIDQARKDLAALGLNLKDESVMKAVTGSTLVTVAKFLGVSVSTKARTKPLAAGVAKTLVVAIFSRTWELRRGTPLTAAAFEAMADDPKGMGVISKACRRALARLAPPKATKVKKITAADAGTTAGASAGRRLREAKLTDAAALKAAIDAFAKALKAAAEESDELTV